MSPAAVEHGGIHGVAQTGFAKSDAYDQHRPRYPADSVRKLLHETRVAGVQGAKVVDLAAGTGIFTEALAQCPEHFDVTAVEPHDGMRQVLTQKQLPGVTVLAGRAESIPLPDEHVDAVFVAQAFHWFANSDTLRELHRILKPHGCLGLVWNAEDYNQSRDFKATTAWESKLLALTWSFEDHAARFRHGEWRKVFEDQIQSTPLSIIVASDPLFALPLGQHEETWTVWLTRDKVWQRYNTLSHIAVTEGDARKRTYQTFMDAINGSDVETNDRDEVALHGRTLTVFTTKIPAEGREALLDVQRPGA